MNLVYITDGKELVVMTTGIGITTRNRPEILRIGLAHFKEFGWGDHIVIIDDNSSNVEETIKVVQESGVPADLYYADTRLGIANAKNACLLHLQEHEHVFLFDDDAWPKAHGWSDNWIDTNVSLGVGHSMYIAEVSYIKKVSYLANDDYTMNSFDNCLGVMLYFNRKCLEALGGYDGSAPNVYGFEHAQVSQRANKGSFTFGHTYLSPSNCLDLIYSLDVSSTWLNEPTPLGIKIPEGFKSSVTKEEADKHTQNAYLLSNLTVNIPLEEGVSRSVKRLIG